MPTPNGRSTGSGAGVGRRGYGPFPPVGVPCRLDQSAGGERPTDAKNGFRRGLPPSPGPAAARSVQRRRTMKARKPWGKTAGLVLHLLIGGLLIFTGSQRVLGSVPPETLVKFGLGEQARLIGAGAILSALLLLIPRTSSLGILLTSSFWGGAICTHMAHGEPYLVQAGLLVLSWAGAYLRNPATLSSFSGRPGRTREVAAESAPAVP